MFGKLFPDKSPYHIKTSPFIWRANQCIGFCVIGISVIKEISSNSYLWSHLYRLILRFFLYCRNLLFDRNKCSWNCYFPNHIFNRDLNGGCLVFMFSLHFSGSQFLINLQQQFRVRKIFRTQVFTGFAVFILCLKLLFRKCVTYVVGCSFIKTCSLTVC